MKKKLTVAFCVMGAMTAAHAGTIEGYARVLNVTPQVEQYNQPRQECHTDYVTERGGRGMTGSVIGGMAGGIIGNQVGAGNGRSVATAAAAVVGAIVGDRLENTRESATERPVRTCRSFDNWQSRTSGYAVTYEYQGRTFTSILPYDPGTSLRVHIAVTPARY